MPIKYTDIKIFNVYTDQNGEKVQVTGKTAPYFSGNTLMTMVGYKYLTSDQVYYTETDWKGWQPYEA